MLLARAKSIYGDGQLSILRLIENLDERGKFANNIENSEERWKNLTR
jgi:hypothetical protein